MHSYVLQIGELRLWLQGVEESMGKHSEPDQTLTKMPSLRAVKSFVAAAKYQSFTRAAEALCVTQAAISRQIRELEVSLGTELFIRSGRTVKLSAEGSVFLMLPSFHSSIFHRQQNGFVSKIQRGSH